MSPRFHEESEVILFSCVSCFSRCVFLFVIECLSLFASFTFVLCFLFVVVAERYDLSDACRTKRQMFFFLFSVSWLKHLHTVHTHDPVFSLIHLTYLLRNSPLLPHPHPSETAGGICFHKKNKTGLFFRPEKILVLWRG